MGRQGPLTSQALGRSPYDIVAQGEGEGDPRAPLQMYDERGRPVNPETRRINKDVVRSHNEVMLVIGVAEPENGGTTDVEAELILREQENEDKIGIQLMKLIHVLEIGGVWGINGTRQRILLYRQYASLPLFQLYDYERSQRSLPQFIFDGLPSFAAILGLKYVMRRWPEARMSAKSRSVEERAAESVNTITMADKIKYGLQIAARSAVNHVRIHLEIFVFMQRMGLKSSSSWLPPLRYFVPFSDSSPIPAPPPITSLSTGSVLQWLGIAALNATPYAAYWVYTKLWPFITTNLWSQIYHILPRPVHPRALSSKAFTTAPPIARSPTEGMHRDTTQNTSHNHPRDINRDEATIRALEGQSFDEPPQPTLGAVRRQSTFSSRGDEYVSDDEETEVVSSTLISFDVEATESNDTPPGIWSAELRPNIVGDLRSLSRDEPIYAVNSLTTLPAYVAADALTIVSSYVLVAPFEAFALRLLARGFRSSHGLGMDDIHDLSPIGSLSWNLALNFLGLEAAHLVIEGEMWVLMCLLTDLFRGCQADWGFFRALKEKMRKDSEEED